MNAFQSPISCCLAAAVLAGCQSQSTAESRANDHMRRANYYQAYQVLVEELGEAAATDPRYRAVRVAYLLERGQEQVFNDREYTAIETFEQVLELDPEDRIARSWIDKAKTKLAEKAVARGDEHERSGELREALLAYDEAMDHVADYPGSIQGIAAVAKTVRERQERAEDHYTRGVFALGEKLYGQTWYHMVNAVALDPELVKAQERRDLAHSHLLGDRYEQAKQLEAAGHHAAALTQYLEIQTQAPSFEGINQRVEHMRREARVDELVRESEMAGLKGEFAAARDRLQQALETTISQRARVVDLQVLVKESESADRYEKARILQFENRKEDALALFKAIEEDWQGQGFRDVKTWISSLEAEIGEAKSAYERGQKAEADGDLKAAVEAYDEALLFYPGYMGLDAKVKELREKL